MIHLLKLAVSCGRWSRQGPTWSSIEYGGKWKALHYMLKRVYSPILVSGYRDAATDMVYLHLTRYPRTSPHRQLTYKQRGPQYTYRLPRRFYMLC